MECLTRIGVLGMFDTIGVLSVVDTLLSTTLRTPMHVKYLTLHIHLSP